jgi:RNA polymerase-binding transcription factor DksA
VPKKKVAKSGSKGKKVASAKKKPAAGKKTAAKKKTVPKKAAKAGTAKTGPAGRKSTKTVKPAEAQAARKARKPSSRDRAALKAALLALRERLTGQIQALKGESLRRADSVYSAEDGTDAFDRQFALSIVSTENDSVFEIDEALRRIDEGTYGVCEQCNGPIERPRLKALPFVRNCVKCQSESEKVFAPFRPTPRMRRR